MEYRVLGPIEVIEEERTVPLGGPKQRAVLGSLLLAANRVVPRDDLVAAVWGDSPPPTAGNALHVYVSRLRRALPPRRLETRPAGYLLHVQTGELDVERFETLVEEARRAAARGAADAAGKLRGALVLWRGAPLEGVELGGFARAEVHRLEELHGTVLEERIEADLARGLDAELVGELEALVARHPFRERLRGQLMLALYRSGRQAEALEQYRVARQQLQDELGIEPDATLRRLHTAILRQTPELAAAERARAAVLFAVLAPAHAGADPEEIRNLLEQAFEEATSALEEAGATVERGLAGALLARFDQDAAQAIAAALALRERLEASLRGSVRARVGVEAGEVLAGPGATTGPPVATASRLAGAAEPGEILVGQDAAALASGAFELLAVGKAFKLT
jgi:DNA-binding SARP family transcriptional activator